MTDLIEFYRKAYEEKPEYFKNLEFIRTDKKWGANVLIFRCRICGSEICKTQYSIKKALASTYNLAVCRNCIKVLEGRGKKYCYYCEKIKPISDFYSKYICNECSKSKKLTAKRFKEIIKHKKSECKIKEIPYNITAEDLGIIIKNGVLISYPKKCPVLGIELYWGLKQRVGISENAPSIDRIDPSLGYVKGNVRIVSCKYNSIKNNSTQEDRVKIAKYWLGNNGKM